MHCSCLIQLWCPADSHTAPCLCDNCKAHACTTLQFSLTYPAALTFLWPLHHLLRIFFFSSVFLAITLCVALALWPLLNCMPFSFPFSVSHLTRWRGNTGSATECIAYPSSDLELPWSLHPPQRDWCLLGSRYTAIHLRLLLPELAGSAARSFACRLLPPSRPLW